MDYNTPLQKYQTKAYYDWAASQGKDPAMEEKNYDLKGYFAENGPVKLGPGQHLTDKFKKPNHPTFSKESKYSTPDMPGGEWNDLGGGKWSFKPSSTNLKYHSQEDLKNYFRKQEPGNLLLIPESPTLF